MTLDVLSMNNSYKTCQYDNIIKTTLLSNNKIDKNLALYD